MQQAIVLIDLKAIVSKYIHAQQSVYIRCRRVVEYGDINVIKLHLTQPDG